MVCYFNQSHFFLLKSQSSCITLGPTVTFKETAKQINNIRGRQTSWEGGEGGAKSLVCESIPFLAKEPEPLEQERGKGMWGREEGNRKRHLLCRGAAYAVIHVDVLHGDEGDAVFLSIGCGAAGMGRESGLHRGEGGHWGEGSALEFCFTKVYTGEVHHSETRMCFETPKMYLNLGFTTYYWFDLD